MQKQLLVLLCVTCIIAGCIGGGTHGYIKRYRYNTSKDTLEKVVHQVIKETPAIKQDGDADYYNDDTNYVSITITRGGLPYEYIFHFYGGKKYWDTSKTSAVSMVYGYDEKRRGGSSGNGGIKWYDFSLKERLTERFEQEFISKIDSVLEMKHLEE